MGREEMKFFDGKYKRRILIESIFIEPMIIATESFETVRDRLEIIEEDEKRENAVKLVGTDRGKHPVAVPGTGKGFIEDMGLPRLQSRFARPESGISRTEVLYTTDAGNVEFDDEFGENWHVSWEEVSNVINSQGGPKIPT